MILSYHFASNEHAHLPKVNNLIFQIQGRVKVTPVCLHSLMAEPKKKKEVRRKMATKLGLMSHSLLTPENPEDNSIKTEVYP